jgi:hypothetical protein
MSKALAGAEGEKGGQGAYRRLAVAWIGADGSVA